MALEIIRGKVEPVGMLADRRIYLSAAKDEVLEENDPAAAYLLATPGSIIPAEDVARLGLELVGGRVTRHAPKMEVPKAEKPSRAKGP